MKKNLVLFTLSIVLVLSLSFSTQVGARPHEYSEKGTTLLEQELSQSPNVNWTTITGQGFDTCGVPSIKQLQDWKMNSPYIALNLYIGGVNSGCKSANSVLTNSYVSQISQQGWYFIPTWVGLQASCSTKNYALMSSDPMKAYNQGISEADAAIDRAAILGFDGSIIYYDIEGFNPSNATCLLAAQTFIAGWSHELRDRGYLAGVYGSANASGIRYYANVNYPPDAIWPAGGGFWSGSYDANATVWGNSFVNDELWSSHQRIYQYTAGHYETWGSTKLYIDSDVIDGIVATYNPVIDKGLNFLRQQHAYYPDGSWLDSVGITGLATLAFLNAGYEETDTDVQKAIQYLLSAVNEDGSIFVDFSHRTYETSMAILALKGTHNPAYNDEISAARNWLVSSQWDEDCIWGSVPQTSWYYGGFGYGDETRPDMSNTQFALLALDAANLPKTDPTWNKAVTFISRSQNRQASNGGYSFYDDGGFIYIPGIAGCLSPGCASYGGATGAGIWGLALANLTPEDPRFAAALNWVQNNYSWNYNPLTNGSWDDNSLYYYYLSMSKALSMARKIRVGIYDWYLELSEKLVSLQKPDGSWSNSNGWLYEGIPELATSYALLALQTRQLPKNADIELVIILHSPADLHLYDEYGSHVGKNYITGEIDTEIPGSSYSPNDPQTISIQTPTAGNYHLELVGTGEGLWQLEIIGYQNGVQVSYASYTGTILSGNVLATDMNVGAFEGGLTIFSSQPSAAAILEVTPSNLSLTGGSGDELKSSFTVIETGGSVAIQGVSVFADDLADDFGNLISSTDVNFDPVEFDLPAGTSKEILVSISIPADIPSGIYKGSINVETLNAGTKSIPLSVEVVSNQPPVLSIPSDQTAQYSDALSFGVSASDPDPTDTLVLSVSGLPDGLSFTDNGDGIGTVDGTAQAPAGTYPVTFSVSDGFNPPVEAGLNVIVTREDAVITPSSENPVYVRVNTAGGTAGPVTLEASITEATDEDTYGDISNAVPVNFTLLPVGSGSPISCAGGASGGGVGGTLNATCTFGSIPVNVYDVHIEIGGDYYKGAADSVLAIYDPSLGFTTGGGTIVHDGTPANFGFNFKYSPKGQPKGNLLFMDHKLSGDVMLKSNALNSMSIVKNSDGSYTAIILGKATYAGVGNYSFQLTVTDKGEPGTGDQIGLKVKNSSGQVVADVTFTRLTLTGGNIQVPH